MKFCGRVGYNLGSVEETGDREGNWKDVIEERIYYGDVLQNTRRWDSSQETSNDSLNINNRISILADAFSYEHLQQMKYVNWMGALWKITNADIQRPRIILSIGGVYDGPTPETPSDAEDDV